MQVIIVGPVETTLFADIVSVVTASVPPDCIHSVRGVQQLGLIPSADLVLVLQQWPDEYTQADVLTLIDSGPLARLLVCYGPWCASDGRTRDIWPPGTRVPVEQAPARLIREFAAIHRTSPPLPLTAARHEVFAHVHISLPRTPKDCLRIAVISDDRGLRDALLDVLTAAGHEPVATDATSIDVLVWDADPWDDRARANLAAQRSRLPDVPIAALCGFFRSHLVQELHAAGITTVVPKCRDNEDLVESLVSAADAGRRGRSIPTYGPPLRGPAH